MHAPFARLEHLHDARRVPREQLRPPLTAARYDTLTRIHDAVGERIAQRELGRKLGVTPSTVSKMLRRLEDLTLVSRAPNPRDRRQRDVTLTPRGRELLLEARSRLAESRLRETLMRCALAPLRWLDGKGSLRPLRRLNGALERVAVAFRRPSGSTGARRVPAAS